MNFKNTTRRGLCWLLVLVMGVSLAACTSQSAQDTTVPETTVPETTVPETTAPETTAAEVSGTALVDFGMSLTDEEGNQTYLYAYDDGMGGVYVDYAGTERKSATMDASFFTALDEALRASGLVELNGQNVYEDGAAFGTMSASYADGTIFSCTFSGVLPQEFTTGYANLDSSIAVLLADVPVYVGQPMVDEGVDEEALAAMMEILNQSGIEYLDTLAIMNVDSSDAESFAYTMGLSSAEGITTGTICAPMMNTTPYSLVIATVEDEASIDTVRADFEASLDWRKWVCVAPESALIAQKGNMVLCLMGSENLYQGTADAIEAAGWTTITTLENPDL